MRDYTLGIWDFSPLAKNFYNAGPCSSGGGDFFLCLSVVRDFEAAVLVSILLLHLLELG
jgi:hypothetical protein